MCGIAGKFMFNNARSVDKEEIRVMTDSVAHRGPDDAGIYTNGSIGLGHRRLSIIDLSPLGHQPMSDRAERIWIVFNGEIYNFQTLREELERDGVSFTSHSDTEVIIYLYKKYGPDCVKKLRGMFAFAIWDADQKQLFIARDRLGKKPLKYYIDRNVFIFASELKAILKNGEVKKEIDYSAIDEYLTFGYVPAPKTGFRNIWKLEPGHYLIVKENGSVTKKQYWDLSFAKKLTLTESEWEERILEKLKESVRLRMIADVPLGAHLSGGVDSSLIVALMAETSTQPVKTYSVGFGNKNFDELNYAKLVAKKYNTDHHEIIVEPNILELLPKIVYHYEEPFADSSAIPSWYLSQATKQHVTVALNGDGGDESFAGYYRYQAMVLYKHLRNIPGKKLLAKLSQALYQITGKKNFYRAQKLFSELHKPPTDFYQGIVSYFNNDDKEKLYTPEFKSQIHTSRANTFFPQTFDQAPAKELLNKILYLGIKTHLSDQLLTKVDIASMANALEVRSPLLDHELIELAAQMPANLKIKGLNKKYILKKIAYTYLPKECIDRPKRGFDVPLEFWFGTSWSKIKNNWHSNDLQATGINFKTLDILKKKFHLNAKKMWSLSILQAWYQAYFKK